MKNRVLRFISVFMIALFCFGVVMCFLSAIGGIAGCEEYARIYDHPITVTATVHRHDSFLDSDDDLQFTSYIKYEVQGRTYSDVQYEKTRNESQLSAIGTQFTVSVHPENPGVLMENVASGFMTLISGLICLLFISLLVSKIHRRNLTRNHHACVDRQTAARDLHIAIRSRIPRIFWFLSTVYLTALILRYPMIFQGVYPALDLLFAVFWGYSLITCIRDSLHVRRDNFRIQRDTLSHKEEGTDSDGDPVYTLHYVGEDRSWSKSVGSDEFNRTPEGHTLQAVYLPKNSRPTIHYENGNAVL